MLGTRTPRSSPRPLALWALLPLLAGCSTQAAQGVGAEAQSREQVLGNAIQFLKEERPTPGTFRSATQQLNNYLDLLGPSGLVPLTADEQKLLDTPGLLDADKARRLQEVNNKSFTGLDTHHLDSCFLFRDAAQALLNQVPDDAKETPEAKGLRLAEAAFGWVTRQVYLQPRVRDRSDWRAQEFLKLVALDLGLPFEAAVRSLQDATRNREPWVGDPWPAIEILRRGSGDAEERLRVFLVLLEQLNHLGNLGIDGCVIPRTVTVRDGEDRQIDVDRPWAAGVRVGKEIYLFEPLLGRPIPGPGGQGIATLRQVRQEPALVEGLYQIKDPDRAAFLAACQTEATDPLAVKAAQLGQPRAWLLVQLTALAPRMRLLQTKLGEAAVVVRLHDPIGERLKQWQAAGTEAAVGLWAGDPRRPSTYGYPTTVLARFQENQVQFRRGEYVILLPVNELHKQAVLAPRFAQIPAWARELVQRLGPVERSRPLFEKYDSILARIRTEPGSVRDMLLRGRLEQAMDRALDIEGFLAKRMDIFYVQLNGRNMAETLFKPYEGKPSWVETLLTHEAKLNSLLNEQRKLRKGAGAAATQLELALNDQAQIIAGLWKGQDIALSYLALEWSVPEVREHLTYYLGLAKMEQALRTEARAQRPGAAPGLKAEAAQQWRAAAGWFGRYQAQVVVQPRNYWGPVTRDHQETCRQALARLEPAPAKP